MRALADEEQTIIQTGRLSARQLVAAAVFLVLALWLATVVPSIQIAWVTCILVLTIYLFAFEVVSVDVAAVSIMVLLGLTSLLAPVMGLEQGLVDNKHLFDGFASNAVMSIIAVMIIGAGLDKTGVMSKVAAFILKIGGTTEKRIIPIISADRRCHILVHAECGGCGPVSAGCFAYLGPLRSAHVTPADADGLYRDPGWHHDHGGLQPVDPAQ